MDALWRAEEFGAVERILNINRCLDNIYILLRRLDGEFENKR